MKKRVVAILGDFYHDKMLAKRSFELAVQQLNQVNFEYTTVSNIVEILKSKPDTVILFAENRLNPQDDQVHTWMDDQAAKAICNYVKDGGSWIAWHAGLASYERFDDYTELLRGYFEYHPIEHQVVTYYADNPSSLVDQMDKIEFLDEHYFVCCDEENTNVFLRSKSVDGSSIAGWEHLYGKGHVICLTPAHREEGLLHPWMIKLLVNSLKLSCNIKI